jgi:hypothetical protein
MRAFLKCLVMAVGVALLAAGCEDGGSKTCYVAFRNDSATKTVCPVWDGLLLAPLAPGQDTNYRETNEGTHTIKWADATGQNDLTQTAWPSLVSGHYYTFPYED